MNKQTKSHSHSHSNLNNQSSSPSTPILVILFFGIYLTFVGTSSNSWKIGKDGNGQLGLEKLCAQVNFVEFEFCNLDLGITEDNYMFYLHYLNKYDEVIKTEYKQKLFTKNECDVWTGFIVAVWCFSALSIFLTISTFKVILTKHECTLYPTSRNIFLTILVIVFFCLVTSINVTSTFSLNNSKRARGFDLFFPFCYLSFFMFLHAVMRNLTAIQLHLEHYKLVFLYDSVGAMISFVMLILISFSISDSRWMVIGVGGKSLVDGVGKNIDPYFFAGMDKQANEMFKISEIMPNETLVFNEIGFFAPSVSTKHTMDPYDTFFINNFLSVNLGGVALQGYITQV